MPGLEIRSSFGYSNIQSNLFLPVRLESYRPEERATSQRFASHVQRDMSSWVIEPQLQYAGRAGKGKIEGLLGASLQQNSAEVFTLFGIGYSSDLLMKTLRAAQSISVDVSSFSKSKFNALFGRLNYVWNDKYIINLTARRDGSSKFGDANKLHNFGGVGLAWLFSREKWIRQGVPFLSFGKLRGSYGTTGNDQVGDFQHLSLYGIVRPGILYQDAIGLSPSVFPIRTCSGKKPANGREE
ncbi:hypothetical protein [Paraflavitalea speifideaquila]|uniref:hypothetical protein n=1 Tax=Paraflavitalea speifideaquila TaxID=3076558 RepID=UPI003312FD68